MVSNSVYQQCKVQGTDATKNQRVFLLIDLFLAEQVNRKLCEKRESDNN